MSPGAVVDEILARWCWLAEDERNGRVGAVCRKYFNHACALDLGTRSFSKYQPKAWVPKLSAHQFCLTQTRVVCLL